MDDKLEKALENTSRAGLVEAKKKVEDLIATKNICSYGPCDEVTPPDQDYCSHECFSKDSAGLCQCRECVERRSHN